MIEHFRSELKVIANGLVLRVMEKLDDTPEAEVIFLQWANQFTELKPSTELWDQLTPHIRFPI